MSKKKNFRVETIEELFSLMDGTHKRYCHLHFKTFFHQKTDLTYLDDLKELERRSRLKNKGSFEMKSNPTRFYYKLLDCLYDIHFTAIEQYPDLTIIVRRIKVLFHLGLFDEAERLAAKISNLDLSSINALGLQELYDLRIKNAIKRVDINYLTKEYHEDRKRQQESLKFKINLIDYQAIWTLVKGFSVMKYMSGSDIGLSDEFKDLLTSEDKALSPEAKVYFHMTKGYFAISAGDTEFALYHSLVSKKIYEAEPRILKWNPSMYVITIKNICISYIFLKMGFRAAEEVRRIEAFKENIPNASTIEVQEELLTILIGIKSDLIIQNFIETPSDIEIRAMEKYFRDYQDKIAIDKLIAHNFVLSVIYYMKGMMREAIKCIKHLISIKSELRVDLQHLGRIVEFSIFWSTGDLDHFLGRLKAYELFLKNSGNRFLFEGRLLVNLKNMAEEPFNKNLLKIMQQELMEDLKEGKNLDYVNYLTLLHSNFMYGKNK